MANVGTSTVAYATQQPTGSLVFVASDGTACVLWTDGTNQKFSYASSPYSSWTTTTLVTGLNMALGGRFRAGTDNIDLVTGASGTVRPNYYPLTKISATYSLGTATQISTTVAGTSAVGNVMQYCGQDPQGRHWIICGGASTYTTSRALNSPANSPTGTWISNISTTQTGDVNQPAGDQIGNYLLKTYWNGTAIQYHRLDTSVATLGAWSTTATIPNLGGSPNASSRVVFRALSSTQGLLVYSTGSGIYAQTYTPGTDTWSTATQLSTNASDRHPQIATDGAGNAWVLWCSFAAANNYALVYKKWDGVVWDGAITTLIASGTNIANPNVGYGNQTIGVTYTVGTANPFTVGWTTFSSIRTFTRAVPSSAALSGSNWYDAGWRYKKTLTLAHSQVSGGTDLANFPVLVSFTDNDLKLSPTGKMQSSSGYDLIFVDANGITQLDHEIDKYDSVAGTITAWVRVPSLSASVDTIITLYFGNSSITTSQESKGTWESRYNNIYHLGNGTTLAVTDSTRNANHGANSGATATSGKIDGGAALASSASISLPTTGMPTGATLWTVETWLSYSVAPTTYTGVVSIGSNVTGESIELGFNGSGLPYIGLKNVQGCIGPSTPSTGTPHQLVGTWDGANLQLYVDGSAAGTPFAASPTIVAGTAYIGQYAGPGGFFFTGTVDEVRVSVGIARTSGWIATQYNNQNAPGTFVSVGATVVVPVTSSRVMGTSAALAYPGTVYRQGTQLYLNGVAFRFGGPNIYWLGLIDTPAYPTQFEVDDALATAKEMGATVVRSHTLGISAGNSLSVETSLGTFNDAAFDSIDYAIYRAGLLGLKLIIPFVDNYHFYMGGKHTFTDWRSLSDETLFYTNSTVIADFEAYISHFLNHVNTYTGVALKLEPAIMAWETGNELTGAPSSWTTTIASYIKSIDSIHLVVDGSLSLTAGPLVITSVDGYTNHYYPPIGSTLSSDATAVSAASKVFFVGEYDWLATPAAATASQDTTTAAPGGGTASARIDETQAGSQDWYVQFAAGPFSLATSTTYTFSFYAKATVGCSFTVTIQDHTTFATYFSQSFTVTTSWAQYTGTTFTVPAGTTADIYVEAGRIGTSLWLDLMSLTGGGPNLLPNPSFETAGLASWSMQVTPVTSLASWLATIEGNAAIAGDCFWSLFAHASGSGFLIHNDGYSLYYPEQTSDQQTREQALRTHAYTMSGLSAPAALTLAAPTNLTIASGTVSWQGTVGAKTYDVERSTTSGSSGFSVIGTGLTDFSTPWTDATAGSFPSKWYRVRGYNMDAVAGAYSSVVFVGSPTRTIGASAALIGTSARIVPASAALIMTKTRTVGATLATLATSTRAVPTSGAMLSSLTRMVGSSAALIGTLTRSISASAALLLTRTRTLGTSAALGITSTRQVSSTVTLLSTSTRAVLASGALQSQATRVIPTSAALSITRVIPTSTALSLTQARTIPASSAFLLTQTRQVGAGVALIATTTRTVPATSTLQRQASRSIPTTGALSISRVVPASAALLLASSRVMPASVALQATSTRIIGSSAALLSTRSRQLATSTALLASISRSIGASAALLGTRTRTIPTDGALSLTGTATRTIPATGALLATLSRTVGTSAALGLSNVTRTVPATAALLRQASRSIPATAALQATASRQVTTSVALLASLSRSIGTSAALLSTASRTVPATTALLRQANRVIGASTSLQATGSRQVPASVALVSQASRSVATSAAFIATLTRNSSATVALIITLSRTLGASAALTLPGVKFRDIPCSASLSGGSRVIPTTVALRGTRTRSIACTASISMPIEGLQIGIPASAALQSTSSRFVVCTVALLASNASLRFRSGVADVRVRSGTATIIVS